MRVVFFPDYTSTNPYQAMLAAALSSHNIFVTGASIRARERFPLLRAVRDAGYPPIAHLHWLDPFFATRRAVHAVLRTGMLLLQLHILSRHHRLLWTIHNLISHERQHVEQERRAYNMIARQCDGIIVHCHAAQQAIIAAYRLPSQCQSVIRIIPMGHFIGYYPEIYTRGKARTRLGLTSEQHTLLYFGQLRRYKNLPYLIDTFRQLPSAHLRLLLVGAPSDRESLDTLREICSADERIRLIAQYVPDSDIPLYMCAADAVLLPFQHILTSSSLVLAMSFGKAAIAPTLGCIPELLTAENGIPYAPYQPDGLVRALRHTSDVDLSARGQRALHTIAATTWTQAASQTAALYRDVLDM